ncbi:MAG TPA: FHA domain-containing protein [Pyrinomonadaceae bacterium]
MSQRNDQWADGKASLLGLSGALTNHRIIIEATRFLVGRDPAQCQLVLDFPTISKRHAMIELDPQGRATLTDLNSSNGTFVNGARVSKCELRDGCQVAFGPGNDAAFTFRAPVRQAPPPQPFTPQFTPPPQQQYTPPQYTPPPVYQQPPVQPPQYAPPPPAQPPRPPAPPQPPAEAKATVVQPYTQTPAPAAGGMHVNAPLGSAFGTGTTHMRAALSPVIRMGRSPDNDIVFDNPAVSRYHATLTYTNQAQPVITDLGSTNGTFVNGEPLKEPRLVSPTDLVYIGGFLLRIEGRDIKQHNLGASRIAAFHLSKDAGGRTILKDISLALYPREFIGLMGPSGCGKSTLMDALNGFRPATSGSVFVNDLDLYRNFNALRRSIGYVPQRDILHETLSVERTLYYAARLRLPEATPPPEIQRVVDEVIWMVGLQEQRVTQFKQLSGGQQKRLSLGLELITKPSFLFLDEPTSPLDPVTTETMMMLFRRLADEGRIVIMVTHKFEKFETMHQVAMLTRGGRLAFFGPPQEALNYFDCQYPGEIYHKIESRDPDELNQAFQRSPQHQRYVATRMAETQSMLGRSGPQAPPPQPHDAERRAGISQWKTLTRRYLEIKMKDKRNIISTLAQPIVLAIVLALITSSLNEVMTLTISAFVAVLFGVISAVREIVGELPIYLRERLANLKIPSYVFSKFVILSAIGFIQCFLWVVIMTITQRLSGWDFFSLLIILYLTFLSGISVGLFFSALVTSVEKALIAMPLIVALQLVLSGGIIPLFDVETPGGTRSGLGVVMNIPAALMPMRWTVDALAHDVSIVDEEARAKLSRQIYVGYADATSEDEIISTSRLHVFLGILMLTIFTGLYLIMTMWALKRKDVL